MLPTSGETRAAFLIQMLICRSETGEIALSCRSHASIDGAWPLGCNLGAFDTRVACLIPLDSLGNRVAVLHPPHSDCNSNANIGVDTWQLSAPLVIQNAVPFEIR
jgi:hypothetical protein